MARKTPQEVTVQQVELGTPTPAVTAAAVEAKEQAQQPVQPADTITQTPAVTESSPADNDTSTTNWFDVYASDYISPDSVAAPTPFLPDDTEPDGGALQYAKDLLTTPEQEKTYRKKAQANQRVIAIADALRHLSNIYYTTKGASPQTYNSPVVGFKTQYENDKAQRYKNNADYADMVAKKNKQDAENRYNNYLAMLKYGAEQRAIAGHNAGLKDKAIKAQQAEQKQQWAQAKDAATLEQNAQKIALAGQKNAISAAKLNFDIAKDNRNNSYNFVASTDGKEGRLSFTMNKDAMATSNLKKARNDIYNAMKSSGNGESFRTWESLSNEEKAEANDAIKLILGGSGSVKLNEEQQRALYEIIANTTYDSSTLNAFYNQLGDDISIRDTEGFKKLIERMKKDEKPEETDTSTYTPQSFNGWIWGEGWKNDNDENMEWFESIDLS